MKPQRIKAEHIPPLYSCSGAPLDGATWVLPADAESYERMLEQVAKAESDYALSTCGDGQDWNEAECARHILRAIGITAPKRGKKGTR